jgi:hypothetical protein
VVPVLVTPVGSKTSLVVPALLISKMLLQSLSL